MAQATINAKSTSNAVRSGIEGTWEDARTAATNPKGLTTFVTQAVGPSSFQCGRYFGLFDLTSIPSGSRVSSVDFIHPVVSNFLNPEGASVSVVDHTASDPVVVGDFSSITLNSDTTYGSVAMSSLSTTQTTAISLDSNGISIIQTAVNSRSLAKLGLRSSLDINNTSPAGITEYTSAVQDFQLRVNYIPPGGGAFIALM